MFIKKLRTVPISFYLALIIVLVVFITPSVFADVTDHSSLIAGAKKEGKVVIYSTMTVDQSQVLSKGFEAKYPFLKAEQVRVAGGETFSSRIVQEANMKKYLVDLIQGTTVNLHLLKQKGLIAPYKPSEPVPFRHPWESDGYTYPVYLMSFVIGYNTKLVSKEAVPRRYEDLLDERWKEKIGMGDNIEWFPFVLSKMGEGKGLNFMRRLMSQQKVKFRNGDNLNSMLLAAGEIQILINVYSQTIERVKPQGAPVDWMAINPTLTKAQVAAVASHAPHPNAARLYLEYFLSKEAQQTIGSFMRIPARQDVRSKAPRMEEGAVFETQDISWLVNAETFKKYNQLYKEIFFQR